MRYNYDVIVCGGGLGGCFAAIQAARAGLRTVIVERDTSLGSEMVSTLKLWISNTGYNTSPDDIKQIFGNTSLISSADLKFNLLSFMQELGIKVLFMSEVSGVVASDNSASGLMLSNKYGNQIIYGKSIIDTTLNVLNMVENIDVDRIDNIFSMVMRYAKVSKNCSSETIFPDSFGIENNKAFLHFGNDRTRPYVEFFLNYNGNNIEDMMHEYAYKIETSIRKIDACFADAELMQFSSKPALYGRKLILKQGSKFKNIVRFHIGSLPKENFSHFNLSILYNTAAKAIEMLIPCDSEHAKSYIINKNIYIPLDECSVTNYDDFKLDIHLENVMFDAEKYLPVISSCEIVVAGGGTAGVSASIAASRKSNNVEIIEYYSNFGGTQTIGLVGNYYYGYVDGFAALQTYNMCNAGLPNNSIGRMIWYYMELKKNNISTTTNTVICGSVIKSGNLHGIITASKGKIGLVKANVIIDATGDSDVLSFCNDNYFVGSLRDGTTQNSSQWEIFGKDYDLDIFNQTKYSELLRGLYMTHFRNSADDFSPILTPRESRRFKGEYTITMADILLSRFYDDCICMARTDCDPHGAMSSLFSYMGLTPYHGKVYNIEIPYRACIPKNINNLLIASKSISATQDATAYLRMACDVQNRGYAIGTAAAMAATGGLNVRDINIIELQTIMLHTQIIPKTRTELLNTDFSIENKIAQLIDGDKDALIHIITSEKEDALGYLEEEFSKTSNINLAIALGWFGSKSGIDTLIYALISLSDNEEPYDDAHPTKLGNNKGGIIDKTVTYWKINQILTVLGIIGDKCCINAVCKVANNTEAGGEPIRNHTAYVSRRMDLQKVPHFDRIKCLCFCIENIADSAFIKPLEALIEKPYISGFSTNDLCASGPNSQPVYVELMVVRTLARCGSVKGLKKLIDLMSDAHYYIAKNAFDEICDIAGNIENAKSMVERGCSFTPAPYDLDGYDM